MSTVPLCPLCGQSKHMRKPKKLYGHDVCKKCVNGFANRRQFAYFIDSILSNFLQYAAGALVVVVAVAMESDMVLAIFNLGLTIAFVGFMLCKDGFGGTSPGKYLMGVKAIDVNTGVPIGFSASLKRNLPTLVPFVILVIAVQLIKGKRWGDGWARTKVIWTKYADNPVFNDKAAPITADFGPLKVELPPVQETANPYQAPRH